MSGLDDLGTALTKYTPGGGRQKILLSDIEDIILSILQGHEVKASPALTWVDATAVRVLAGDSLARVMMCGFPNVLHPGTFITGDLTDGLYRENSSNVTMDFDSAATFWGAELASQWYAIYAIADDADPTFTLKAMPWMRYSSHAASGDDWAITFRNNLNSGAADYGAGLVDELIGGAIYVVSGASKGLLRTITDNTGTTVTYSGDEMTMTQGDWFIVLPPGVNFRYLGDVFNTSGSNIQRFIQGGDWFEWYDAPAVAISDGVTTEHVIAMPPLANEILITGVSAGGVAPGAAPYVKNLNTNAALHYLPYDFTNSVSLAFTISVTPADCKLYANFGTRWSIVCLKYRLPSGMLG